MELQNLIEQFLTACRAAGLSPKTVTWYEANLTAFREFVGNRDWRSSQVVREFLAELQARGERYSAHPTRPTQQGGLSLATVRGYGRTLKRFFHWLVDEGRLDADPLSRVKLPRAPKHIPRGIAMTDFETLLAAAESPRDRALLLLLADTGCRAAEICGLRLNDVNLEDGLALVRGKGDKERLVAFSAPTADALRAWLAVRLPSKEDWLFVGQRGRFSSGTIFQVLRRLRRKAGVTGRCNPHSFRHGFAREYLLNGGDLASLSDLLGHADIATTKVYSAFAVVELKRKHQEHSPVARLFGEKKNEKK